MVTTKTYLVTKRHKASEVLVDMLYDQLHELGWQVVLTEELRLDVYNRGDKVGLLLSVATDGAPERYEFNGRSITVAQRSKLQQQLLAERAVYGGYEAYESVLLLKRGSADSITVLTSDSGAVYASCTGVPETHAVLTERFAETEHPLRIYTVAGDSLSEYIMGATK